MAHSKSAEKRIRQDEKRRVHNKAFKSMVHTQVKKFLAAVSAGDTGSAQEEYKKTISAIDRGVKHGLYHRNYASRKKSRLLKMIASSN
jgi:small subunit ribosomal protein S20